MGKSSHPSKIATENIDGRYVYTDNYIYIYKYIFVYIYIKRESERMLLDALCEGKEKDGLVSSKLRINAPIKKEVPEVDGDFSLVKKNNATEQQRTNNHRRDHNGYKEFNGIHGEDQQKLLPQGVSKSR